MRLASRIIGGLLILGAFGFIGLAILLVVKNAAGWLGALVPAVVGVGLLFAARREFSVLAQVGLAISLFRLVGLFDGRAGS